MVNGPGRVILMLRLAWARRKTTSGTSTAVRRRIGPQTRGTGMGTPLRLIVVLGPLDIDPLQRGREAVGIAFAAYLAVGDDVDARALHIADCKQRSVVLRFFEEGALHTPHVGDAYARNFRA